MNPTQAPKVKAAQLHWALYTPWTIQFDEFSGQSNGVGSPFPGTQALYILLAYTLSNPVTLTHCTLNSLISLHLHCCSLI